MGDGSVFEAGNDNQGIYGGKYVSLKNNCISDGNSKNVICVCR